ncbi:unnamed protein product, partial [Pylaiella littoralis]
GRRRRIKGTRPRRLTSGERRMLINIDVCFTRGLRRSEYCASPNFAAMLPATSFLTLASHRGLSCGEPGRRHLWRCGARDAFSSMLASVLVIGCLSFFVVGD